MDKLVFEPIFFENNRVSRVYTGGKMLSKFMGQEEDDGYYPEEWIASDVVALNDGNVTCGVSTIKGTDIKFDQLLRDRKQEMLGEKSELGILVKYLDSAIRLPAQAHPDKQFAIEHLNSNHGKAEMWLILALCEDAKLYFGFDKKSSILELEKAIADSEQNARAMEKLMHVVDVKVGDVFFVPPKVIHAIGKGCLILEVQEPTDFTIQPEATCGEYQLNDYEKYLGLEKNTALQCFDFSIFGDEAEKIGRKIPNPIADTSHYDAENLVTICDTGCFEVNRYTLNKSEFALQKSAAIYIVVGGEGEITGFEYANKIAQGDYFFMPNAAINKYKIVTDTEIVLIECYSVVDEHGL